jgi:FlgD Ig-like domain/Fibronectin type III domain
MLKKNILIFIIYNIWLANLPALVEETTSFTDFLYGSTTECAYDNWISHVSEGIANDDYNIYSPWDVQTSGFGDFHIANSLDLANWESVVDAFLDGFYDLAQTLIDDSGFPYEVVQFNDVDTDKTYYLLRELLNLDYFDDNETQTTVDDEEGSFDYGWGLYVHNPLASNPIIVTVPHPNDDFIAPAVSYKCFQEWDATFLLINGTGREVKWTEQGSYTNSKSLSDPSRILDHAFNVGYQKFCDRIRTDYGQRELSTQIHSYDWDRHDGHPACQISAGSGRTNPNLPIRDLSDLHNDIINNSNHLMIPANTIGTHSSIYLNDYYSVYYSVYDFLFQPETYRDYEINHNVDLAGYGANRQMQYSYQDWNNYDVFEPFFHVEMDELPICYEETEANYKSYYSYNFPLGYFNMDQLFDNVLEFNSHWIDAMTETLPMVMDLNDNISPQTPENFTIDDVTHNSISLSWNHVSSMDFYTYEIQYSDEPITGTNYTTITRDDNSLMANQRKNYLEIEDLALNRRYYFRICTYDYNSEQSAVSEEITASTGPVVISYHKAVGGDGKNNLYWTAGVQNGNLGFNVYEQIHGELFLIDSWQNNSALLGSTIPFAEYSYEINNLPNKELSNYVLSCHNEEGEEFIFPFNLNCETRNIYDIYISNSTGTMTDTVSFAMNEYAMNGLDDFFDIEKDFDIMVDYLFLSLYKQNWAPGGMHLRQITDHSFDAKSIYHYFELNLNTNQVDEVLRISLGPEFSESWEKLYLKDPSNNQIINLANNDFYYSAESNDMKTFYLYWGNYKPEINFYFDSNIIYQAGSEMEINWTIFNLELVEYMSLYAITETDTLLIANQLSQSVDEFLWQIPDNITLHNARIRIDIYTNEGEVFRYLSSQKIGIVPSVTTISNNAGWSLVSNPWPSDQNLEVETVFGADATLIQPIYHAPYEEVDTFEFATGYWVNSPSGYEFSSNAAILNNTNYIQINRGWNLVANPHNCSYKLKDLYFLYNGSNRSFSYMNNSGLIPNILVAYVDGSYTKVDSILPHQAVYLFTDILPTDEVSCRFRPYFTANFIQPEQAWSVKIKASQNDGDEIILGTADIATDGFDFSLDLPQTPLKPFDDCVYLYIPKENAEDFLYQNLTQEFKPVLQEGIRDTVRWDFSLNADPETSVTLEFDFNMLPENYRASVYLADNSWCNLVNNVYIYSFAPLQTQVNSGYIKITNNFTGSEELLPPIFEFTNYPNPFNPDTKIEFNLLEDAEIELTIYNLKGQKVRRLISELLPEGQHSVVWNGTNEHGKQTASGIYFISIQTNNKTLIRKTLLLK